jgi:hypothetical protein
VTYLSVADRPAVICQVRGSPYRRERVVPVCNQIIRRSNLGGGTGCRPVCPGHRVEGDGTELRARKVLARRTLVAVAVFAALFAAIFEGSNPKIAEVPAAV